MKKPFAKKLSAMLCAVILLCGLFSACFCALAEDRKTVRVGYMDYHGFINLMTDGTYSGYGAEYLSKVAEYTGWHYEYVYGNWSDLLEMLKNKEIDLLCNAQYTKRRSEIFDFSRYPIGYTQGLLYTRSDNKSLSYEDYASFDGMTVGIISNNAMEELYRNYEKRHGFVSVINEYDSEEALLAALEKGEIDAMCSEHLANHQGLSLLARYGADSYYFISYKDSPIISEIDEALQQIKSDVDFETDLFHKYYDSSTAASSLQFTLAEREFIAESKQITVALDIARPPMSSYDEKTDAFTGICPDILDQISQKSGLTFKLVPMPVGEKPVDVLASGEYDMVCGIEHDNFITNDAIDVTSAFLESAIVPACKEGLSVNMTDSLVAAVPKAFQALQKQLSLNYPNVKMELYGTNRECLDAVLAGKADLFIQNTHIMTILLQEPRYDSLAILPVEIMTEHTAIALNAGADKTLLSILDKSIALIDAAAVSATLIRHTVGSPYHYTLSDILSKFKLQIIIITALVLISFSLFMVILVVQRRNEANLQTKNAQLADAVAQADRASVAKSQFLSRMSHEIRTPMNAIVGLTEIAKMHDDDPKKTDEYLNKIAVSSKVLLNILNDVLDMSTIESEKLKIAASEFDVGQLIDGIRTIYEPQCQSKGVEFEISAEVKHEYLIGDSLRVNQVLLNFVSNAYKFTPAGGRIRVSVLETAEKEGVAFLRFSVSDTGAGMTPDMKARLFNFEQETAATAQKHGGSGLGLSITKNLVDMMHGMITVESEKGKGSTFTVDLPFTIAEHSDSRDKNGVKDLRVLVIDDDKASLEYSSIVLKRIGVMFDVTDTGSGALEMFDKAETGAHPYDVCMIDAKMPQMDGLELTRLLRSHEKKHTHLLIISAKDMNEIRAEATSAGADGFITKPLFQSSVFNALISIVGSKPQKKQNIAEKYDFTGHRVMLVEDQELNAEIATELLSFVNMSVDAVDRGRKAIDLFASSEAGRYDAILMDIQMPEMDGYEATAKIRALERPDAKTIPIFAMTANAFTEDVSAALSAGMNGHISKPIDTAVLYATLKRIVDNTL
ncbi:MAG: response regulator [Eubacteriales bacterium]|nr:response regulator [Eubacteriales bacterium]MDD3882040.1 response regulator [Eubacteriales bacterium]MDD4512487.1 response regulator [Eubacteriales bacterium]